MITKELTKQTLHAQRYDVIYESSFHKFLRNLQQIQKSKWWILASMPMLIYFGLIFTGFSYLLSFFIGLIVYIFISSVKLFYNPKLEELHTVGINNYKDNDNNGKYYLHLGDATRSIELIRNAPRVKKDCPHVLEYPVLIDFDMALRHMFVVGTTGSGKTTFLIYLLQQHLEMGGGAIIVDGKGDKDIYTDVYNTCVHTNREDDFNVINFNVPKESNTMNPLLKGNEDEVIDVLGNMLETEGDNSFWAGRALAMMKGLLSLLVPLRELNILYDPSKDANPENDSHPEKCPIEPIFTFKVLNKFIDLLAMRNLYTYTKALNANPKLAPANAKWTYVDTSRIEGYLSSCSVPLADTQKHAKISDSMSKMHGNSNTMWGEGLDLFMGTFGDIFNTDAPDIDMEDVVVNSRILYILLPATKKDPKTLSMLGKIVLAFFKAAVATLLGDKISGTIEERRGSSAIRPKVPFWGVMDEYGAYATSGFDNVLAQARSLRVSISIMVQETASLEKGGDIDKKRLLGNTGIKVFLKIEENNTIKEVIEFFGDQEQATVKKQNENAEDLSYEISKKPLIDVRMLKDMSGGHGYVAFSGHITPMLAGYYKPPNSRVIMEFDKFRLNTTQNYLVTKEVDLIESQSYMLDGDLSTLTDEQKITNINTLLSINSRKNNEMFEKLHVDKLLKSINDNNIKFELMDWDIIEARMEEIIEDLDEAIGKKEEDDEEDSYNYKKQNEDDIEALFN